MTSHVHTALFCVHYEEYIYRIWCFNNGFRKLILRVSE